MVKSQFGGEQTRVLYHQKEDRCGLRHEEMDAVSM